MDAQPGGAVQDVDDRSEALDRIAYPVDADAEPADPADPESEADDITTDSGDDPENSATDSADEDDSSAD